MEEKTNSQVEKSYEIDLREVALSVLGAWYWLVGALILSVSLALIYLWLVTPIYEVQFRADPASDSNFADFNHFNDFEILPEDAYKVLGRQLTSFQNFEAFVEQNQAELSLTNEMSLIEIFQERFTFEGLVMDRVGNLTLNVHYRYPEGENGDKLLNTYIAETSRKVWAILHARFSAYNQSQLMSLNINQDLEKEALRTEREEEIFEIEKAIITARNLNIETPTIPYQLDFEASNNQIFFSPDDEFPLYFMGYQTLETERDTLQSSLNVGLSNERIREIQQNIAIRQQISEAIGESELADREKYDFTIINQVVNVVEYAFPTDRPVSPNRLLVLALALVVGCFLGIVALLMSVAFKKKAH